MEINIRTLLPFLLFYFLKESSAQMVHNVFTYTSKLKEELECVFTSTLLVQWTEQRDDGVSIGLFLYDVTTGLVQKQTDDIKYDNFNYSIKGTNRFNLVINNVEQDDAGRYLCNPITTDAVTFDVTVEVLPKSISINCTESNVCMPSAGKETVPEITCVCTATGVSSSQLGIQWDGVDITSTSSTAYGSSSISSEITLRTPNGTSGISCSLTGYRSQIPERSISYSYTFSPPVCTLTSECPSDGTSASLICSCSKGSPSKVHGYSFYDSQMLLIGTQLDSSLQVDSEKNETFYCKGCNGVLHDQFVSHALNCNQAKSSALWLLISIIFGILVLQLLVVVLIIAVKKLQKPVFKQEENVEGGPEESHGQAERMNLLNKNGDKQNIQEVQGSGPDNKSRSAGSSGVGPGKVKGPQNNAGNENEAKKGPPRRPKKKGENNITSPSQSSVPAPKVVTKPDNKSRSAGSSGVGPGEVTGHQNNAGNENIEKKKPPVVPKKKVENNQSADNSTRTNGGESTNQAPLTTERTQGDGRADTDTQGMNEDSPSPTNHGQGSLEDLRLEDQHPEGNPKDSLTNNGHGSSVDPLTNNGHGSSVDPLEDQHPEGNPKDRGSVTANNSGGFHQTIPNPTLSEKEKGEIRCQIRM